MAATTPVYRLEHVTKQYAGQNQPANLDISLEIRQGEIFGFLGDNGAGKSTLIRQMVNLLKSTSGNIWLFDRPLVGGDALLVSRYVGYMPQEGAAFNSLTVGEALYHTARLRGLSRADSQRESEALLESWQIGAMRGQVSARLSGGQRRLLRLAVALAGRPPVLVLDEPTNDLDPQHRKLVWDRLNEENRARGVTILFITHDAIEAEKIIQRVGILRAGQLVALGSPSVLKREIDRKLRLELIFAPERPPHLPAGLDVRVLQPGRWLVYLDRPEPETFSGLPDLFDGFDLRQVEDFRLYSATLEDLYMHYATHTH